MKKLSVVLAFLTASVAFGQQANLPSCSLYTAGGVIISPLGAVAYIFDTASWKDTGGVVAPGQLITLAGIGLSLSGSNGPYFNVPIGGAYGTSLMGTQVFINGELAPAIAMAGNGPLPFEWALQTQVPWDVDVSKPLIVKLQMSHPDGSQCLSDTNIAFKSTAIQPGLFLDHSNELFLGQSNGPVIVQNDGYNFLTFYMNGLAKPVIPVPTGTIAPLAIPMDFSTNFQVLIDGNAVWVPYVGLAPQTVGVFQVNVYAPLGSGTHTLDVTVGGKKVSGKFTTQ